VNLGREVRRGKVPKGAKKKPPGGGKGTSRTGVQRDWNKSPVFPREEGEALSVKRIKERLTRKREDDMLAEWSSH